jgi:hypothetical protein
MTMSVKLPPALEQSLRRRSAALARPASELIREALQAYLDTAPSAVPSAYELGKDLFGKYSGPSDLARRRKETLTRVLADKRRIGAAAKARGRRGAA